MKFNLRALLPAAVALAFLSACGNDPQAVEGKASAKSIKQLAVFVLTLGHKSPATPVDAATLASLRGILEQTGEPIYRVAVDKLHFMNFMARYGDNGPVRTWASNAYETVSLNDGMLVATRGFGADLMSAIAPGVGQASSASGFFHRTYYYLDGADQPQHSEFDCYFAPSGSEAIILMGKSYTARRVTESCANPGEKFDNVYWFDGSGKLRQSEQFVSTRAGKMQLQRIVD